MNDLKQLTRCMDDYSRRAFLTLAARRVLAVGLAPYALGALASAEDAAPAALAGFGKAQRVIYLYMEGGMSHLDTFDPKPGTEWQGSTQSIRAANGQLICESLPQLAAQMNQVALVRTMTTATGAHYPGLYVMHTSYAERGTIRHPYMGAWIQHFLGRKNEQLPGSIQIGGGSRQPDHGFMDSKLAPLRIGDPEQGLQFSAPPRGVSQERFDRRLALAAELDKAFCAEHDHRAVRSYTDSYDEAVRLMRSTDLAAFDLTQEPMALRQRYGENQLGQGCLLARRLVERDVRFVEVSMGGWDTHYDNFERVADNCATLDAALATLLADLAERGLLETTLVVLATEFGRKPEIDVQDGRGHWPGAFSCLLAGAGVKGGAVHGTTDERGAYPAADGTSVQDFNATIAHLVGLPLEERVYSPSGRPFLVADKGKPLATVLG